ncbi:hypothetical protein [Polaromonas sp.]|uniref:hypothetical protein n=1 Tax=Polaromonas sp. TaxID=1869339 RepID=UPI003563D5CB
MKSALVLIVGFFVSPAGVSQPNAYVVPQLDVHFSNSWCPRPEERAELAQILALTMNGCCIAHGTPSNEGNHFAALAKWRAWIVEKPPYAVTCKGVVVTAEEQADPAVYSKLLADKANVLRAARQKVQAQVAPTMLREMSEDHFCESYGRALRGDALPALDDLKDTKGFVKTESRRRRLNINDLRATSRELKLGDSQCQLYASKGFPQKTNRSVGSWGVHIQHVYRTVLVYTENGRVSAYQD